MFRWSFLRRLLSFVAALQLLTAPVAAYPAAALTVAAGQAVMEEMTGQAEDMPCCPQQKQSLPDCQKSCPLATLCAVKWLAAAPEIYTSRAVILEPGLALAPFDEAVRDLMAEPPPPRPPRT
ncbi:MAG: hypothetical protein U1E62_21965 [Alsobacter sp.]